LTRKLVGVFVRFSRAPLKLLKNSINDIVDFLEQKRLIFEGET
jgi:hypothetical protein